MTMCGCIPLIGEVSGAKYPDDVPIYYPYKFSRDYGNLGVIAKKIIEICEMKEDFKILQSEFNGYRERIKKEEEWFKEGVKELVKRL